MDINHLLPKAINEQVTNALQEDIGEGDITAQLIPKGTISNARIITRSAGIFCGKEWANETFKQLHPDINLRWHIDDGDTMRVNQQLVTLAGPARALLTGERTALNFMQLLSGTATTSHEFMSLIRGTKAKLLDTRKTIPGLRIAQKYAVLCGGCQNHRLGLFDAYLIKENHITACGSISQAIETARQLYRSKLIEVEVETLEQLDEALAAKPDIVMLDNFDYEAMRQAVSLSQGKVKLEVSGNVSMQTVKTIAETGVDYISIGAMTKHVKAIDLSMRILSLVDNLAL